MVAPGRRDVKKDAAGGGLWRKIMGYLEAQLDKTPCPTHAVWRSPPATHHRTIMMLVTLIPKGSSGTRTSQPSMNTVATVDKNLRLALKAAKAAAAARQQGWCRFEETASVKRGRLGARTQSLTHTKSVLAGVKDWFNFYSLALVSKSFGRRPKDFAQ